MYNTCMHSVDIHVHNVHVHTCMYMYVCCKCVSPLKHLMTEINHMQYNYMQCTGVLLSMLINVQMYIYMYCPVSTVHAHFPCVSKYFHIIYVYMYVGKTTAGRNAGCDIQLMGTLVARNHW